MIDVAKLAQRRQATNSEYIGARIDKPTKDWLEAFCELEGVTVSSVVGALVRAFRAEKEAAAGTTASDGSGR